MQNSEFVARERKRRFKRKAKRFAFLAIVVLMVLGIALLVTQIIKVLSPDKAGKNYFTPTQNVLENPSIIEINKDTQTDFDKTPYGPVMTAEDEVKIVAKNAADVALNANGRVDSTYFSDAVFVGDSLTEGLVVYTRDMFPESTKFLFKRGVNPLSFMTGQWELTTGVATNPLQDVINTNPAKIYVMLGLNGMSSGQKDDVILKYYDQMLDAFIANCPNAKVYVQSLLPVGANITAEQPDVFPVERIKNLNEQISQMTYKKGLYYLNIYDIVADENGNMKQTIANDGYHMTKEGYQMWVEYLVTHTAHSEDNPYLLGSPYYVAK